MRKLILLIIVISTAHLNSQERLPCVDAHAHIVTDEYLKYLADNDALMDDGYPLPSWNEKFVYVNGKVNYNKMHTGLFEFQTYSYILSGGVIGKCRKMHDNRSKKV